MLNSALQTFFLGKSCAMTLKSNQRFIFQKLRFHGKYLHVTDGKDDADLWNIGKDVIVCLKNIIQVASQGEGLKKMERQFYVYTLWSANLCKFSQPRSFQVGHNYFAMCLHEKRRRWIKIWKLKIKNKMQSIKSYDNAPLNNLSRTAVGSLLFQVFKSSLEDFREEMHLLNPQLWVLLTGFLGEGL